VHDGQTTSTAYDGTGVTTLCLEWTDVPLPTP
jgi:hypothetical protein